MPNNYKEIKCRRCGKQAWQTKHRQACRYCSSVWIGGKIVVKDGVDLERAKEVKKMLSDAKREEESMLF